ncbi:hypothetical protein IMG5_201540 [Ichthyophthirius multifiliis]|uniref:Uncharacterized protein n=1 Tax=Ichthyophthirius multifiliis TaxID=5932 RepID=G0R5V2_ICHMU|nr:hypothetical protein IMG5_201540 [Ichthyophthirius multifiliis]EGR27129.1 hypothetical protein IMG5_201540 [Ichthyophthirius multifiliis]|eukprot:XP_004024013.1 hypothetical protein IMG5_201540 [Ichthyophthirius multifiliis]
MPPKKKIDPELQQQQFEQYLQTDEYKKWEELNYHFKKYDRVTETTVDINGPWQPFFDELMSFFTLLKIKTGKIKELKHEYIRSFFSLEMIKKEKKFTSIQMESEQLPLNSMQMMLGHQGINIVQLQKQQDLEDSTTFNAQTYLIVKKTYKKLFKSFLNISINTANLDIRKFMNLQCLKYQNLFQILYKQIHNQFYLIQNIKMNQIKKQLFFYFFFKQINIRFALSNQKQLQKNTVQPYKKQSVYFRKKTKLLNQSQLQI